MEYYDVIIIGAGIAGCGLAYNLKRIGYKGSVLVIDRKKLGFKKDYGHRTIFPEVIKEYNLKYHQKYKGVKLGIYNKVVATSPGELYGADYQQICSDLLKRSSYEFKEEESMNVIGNKLFTKTIDETKAYNFKYLIDGSGPSFFLRRRFNLPMPSRYWLGRLRLLKNKTDLDKRYIYYFYGDGEYLEDVYVVGNNLAHGEWSYSRSMKGWIPDQKNNILKTYYSPKTYQENIIRINGAVIPVTPTLPLTYKKRYAFLGDSFGNAPPISVYGIEAILRTSKLLAESIKKGDLQSYENEWKNKYLEVYLKRLAVKVDLHPGSRLINNMKNYPSVHEIIRALSKYPSVYINMLKRQYEIFELPKEITKKYPQSRILWILAHYSYFKIKYFLMDMKFKYK